MNARQTYITSAQLARAAMVDRRTAEHRLTRVGIDPDAHLREPTGLVGLWDVRRVPELVRVIICSRSTPLSLADLIETNAPSK